MLGVLNSKLIYVWLYNRGKRKGEILELIQVPLCEIPIAEFNDEQKHQISELAQEITRRKAESIEADTDTEELMIDEIVYAAYGLTPEEIVLVENTVR